jgi:hypothetical protein
MFKCNTVSVSFSACRCSLVVFSSKVGRERKQKESGESFVNGICGCGLPACCCQPTVAGDVIYADPRVELITHLSLQALFTQHSPVFEPLLQAFPIPCRLGEMTLHLLSQACVFVYSSCGKWVFPPLQWSFLPSATLTSFPAHGCWARTPAPTILACLFTVPERIPFPQSSAPSFPCVFVVLIAYYSVSLFSPGGGWSVQGTMLIWPRVVCGSTVVPLNSPCPHLPQPSGCG